ncbi:MAG: dihydroorotate dehydrogenase (quinone) [Candidatus Reconcilbacillus cellulovorans]|uniref:Dihydroorotate dehydrogenase (quinone) n=1 Tax=Candidatus Reconcilbacillus cellulovorans TaxID=1906605 RepID=A0A2A6DYL4_9BACL|nr:MAG: dihydroorotate dehydrogenase (quinone) [Candidatus Reconcilbacillus cellulovorans]
MDVYAWLKPMLFRMDPERAHRLTIAALGFLGRLPAANRALSAVWAVPEDPGLRVEAFGLSFPHPVGLAAGLDKNGEAATALASLGFGFLEVGTVTPEPQEGNPRPRLFRLPEDGALVNRMGFNNDGADALAARLAGYAAAGGRRVPIGVNIGKNRSTPNDRAADDYRACVRKLWPHADFFVLNVSSPNTPGLRDLQKQEAVSAIISAVRDEIARCAAGGRSTPKPVLVKISPDLDEAELSLTVEAATAAGASGFVATNTTLARDGVRHPAGAETGGLSGRPLRRRATETIARVYRLTGGRVPIIGCGGIFDAGDAYEKIRAGASLVEIYTSLIYKGPSVIREICEGLRALAARDGFRSIAEAVGTDAGRRIQDLGMPKIGPVF